MDAKTHRRYERDAQEWIAARTPSPRNLRRAARLAKSLGPGARIADLGCGPGWYANSLGRRGANAVALDAAAAMLRAVRSAASPPEAVRGDVKALPFGRGVLDGAIAYNVYQHLPVADLPVALAHLHHAVRVGGKIDFTLSDSTSDAANHRGGVFQMRLQEDAFPDRLFSFFSEDHARRLLAGAGFENVRIDHARKRHFWLWISGTRAHTLPDYIRPRLQILFCGLNPSLRSAETGVPYGRPGNRFWPAATRAGLCPRERDPWAALEAGIGITDFVKRPTRGASDLDRSEYAIGLERLRDCILFYRPKTVCFVGLDGWRRTVDRRAREGWIDGGFAGRPAYLMPSTSGLNAHCDLGGFVQHFRRVMRGAPGSR